MLAFGTLVIFLVFIGVSELSDYRILVSLIGAAFPIGEKEAGADIRFTEGKSAKLSQIENFIYNRGHYTIQCN
jgi:hypothetical protein